TAWTRIAGARGSLRRTSGTALHLSRLLVGLPRRAAALRLPLLPAIAAIDVARVDIGISINVYFVVAAPAVATAAPGGADRGAPDQAGGERSPRCVRVVVTRIWRRIVAVYRSRAVHDDTRRVVLRHVDHLRIGRNDLDDLLLDFEDLLAVALQVAGRLRLAAKGLHRVEYRLLVGDHGLAKLRSPVEVGTHLLDDFGIVDQRLDRVIPAIVDRHLGILFSFLEKTVGLDDLQRIGRRREDDRHQIVGVQRDRTDQLVELLRRRGLRDIAGSGRGLCRGQRRADQCGTRGQRQQPHQRPWR